MSKRKINSAIDKSATVVTFIRPTVMHFSGRTIRELQSTSTEEVVAIVYSSSEYFRRRRQSATCD